MPKAKSPSELRALLWLTFARRCCGNDKMWEGSLSEAFAAAAVGLAGCPPYVVAYDDIAVQVRVHNCPAIFTELASSGRSYPGHQPYSKAM